jgi:hypothetical protein
MLFDDPDSVTSRSMNRALGALLSLPPAKQLLATEQIRSTFVKTIVETARKKQARSLKRAATPVPGH